MARRLNLASNLEVVVDDVVNVGTEMINNQIYHRYVYFITIENKNVEPIILTARKWIISEKNTSKLVIEGEGIVGEKPHLGFGEKFSYNSSHLIQDDATVCGAFYGMYENSQDLVYKNVPCFTMSVS